MDTELICPRCKTTKYRNPSLKLYVNTCGHSLCDNCIDLLFIKGSSQCFECKQLLRRNNFRLQVFENVFVEKEIDIRKKILKDYNKLEEDFDNLNDYNDYLEEIETIIYNLVNNVDVDETRKRIEKYKKENNEQIVKNRSRQSKDNDYIDYLLEEERRIEEYKESNKNLFGIDNSEKLFIKAKKLEKEKLIDDLMYSNLSVNQILDKHANNENLIKMEHDKLNEKQEQHRLQLLSQIKTANITSTTGDQSSLQRRPISGGSYFSTGIKVGGSSDLFLPLPKEASTEAYKYEKPKFDPLGPECVNKDQLESDGYILHIRNIEASEKAGGFTSEYPCLLALQEAFCGLYFKADN